MEIFDCEQRSEEWFRVRFGMPTASEFPAVLAKGKGSAPSKTRQTYMRKLAGEIVTNQPMENYTSGHMERGIQMEAEARRCYAFVRPGTDLKEVGFISNHGAGCSPDALNGDAGMAEIKTKLPHLLIEVLKRGGCPPEHVAQVQGQLWVAEREWCDLVVYWPNMPIFIHRCERDEAYITRLAAEVERFNEELSELVEWLKAY